MFKKRNKWVVVLLLFLLIVLAPTPLVSGEEPEQRHRECVDTPRLGPRCVWVWGPGPDTCATDAECQPYPAGTCDQYCKSLGYEEGRCGQAPVYPGCTTCEPDETNVGPTQTCYRPQGKVCVNVGCCCQSVLQTELEKSGDRETVTVTGATAWPEMQLQIYSLDLKDAFWKPFSAGADGHWGLYNAGMDNIGFRVCTINRAACSEPITPARKFWWDIDLR